MRFNSLLKRRSPSASPLRDISIATSNSSSHSLPSHMSMNMNASMNNVNTNTMQTTSNTCTTNDANNNCNHNYQSDCSYNNNSHGCGYGYGHSENCNTGNNSNYMPMINQGNERCSSRCSSMSISSSSSSSLAGGGRGEVRQAQQQQQQHQHQQQQLVSGELVLLQELQNDQQYGHYHYMNNNRNSSNHLYNSNHQHQHQHQHQHIQQGYIQQEQNIEQYQYDSSKKMYKPFQFTFSSILNVILNNLPCNCIKHHFHNYTLMMPSPSQSFDGYATSNTSSSTSRSTSPSLHDNDYYNNKQNYSNGYNVNHHHHHHPNKNQQQEPYHFRRRITCRNTIYFIKRYIQIFTLLLILHLTFVGLYNRMHVPNTCEVADLSIEKLKLMNWIGRDVPYIIHDGNSESMNAATMSEVDGDDYNYGFDNINGNVGADVDVGVDVDVVVGSESYDPGEVRRRALKRNKESMKANAKSSSYHQHQEMFKPELPKIIHHQWKTDTVPGKYAKWYDQWKVHFPEPEYQHILWTDGSARDLIAEHYSWFLPTYDNYDLNIKRADAARYFILHYMGGIYADLDYEPMINFYNYLPQNQVGLVESPYVYNEKTQNSFMTSPRGDPFWVQVFEGLGVNAQKSVLHATGPSFLDGMVEISKHPVYTLPCENFHRIPYGELKESRWSAVIGREVITRLVPVNKHCGYFKEEDSCQFGKHHNAAGWTAESFL